MKTLLAAVLVLPLLAPTASAGPRRRAAGPRESYPNCSMVTGSSAVTFTRNEGWTVAPFAVPTRPIAYTYGLASMVDELDSLVAWHRDDLLLSTDGGCSW